MIEVERVEPTGLFTNYIFKAIPLAFDESMSYYETLCGLLNYMKNTMIPALNNNADAVIELQGDFTDFTADINETVTQLEDFVNNYFDNLDVQEEINNKLDAMVEDGTLPEIIATYLNAKAIFCFDNVADLKESTNLINGSYAKTLGYHTKNDGGSALYKIRTITNDDVIDEMFILEMDNDNTLIAELIFDNNLNINMLGAYGDGTHDDTQIIQNAFNKTNIKELHFVASSVYAISNQITLNQGILLRFNNAKILGTTSDACIYISGDTNQVQHIYDFNFDGQFISNIALKVSDCRFCMCYNPLIRNVNQKGVYVFRNNTTGRGLIYCYNISIENQITTDGQYTACANSIGIDLEHTDSQIFSGSIKDFKTSIKCQSSTLIDGVHAWNYRDEFVADSIMIDAHGGVRIINCYADGIPTFVKQNTQTQYSNIDISSSIYHFIIGDQSIEQFTPVPIIKGSADHVNISNSTFETSFYNQNYPIANTFENLFINNTFCSKAYYENYYKGSLTEEGKGTITYERINDVVYFKYDGIQAGTSDVSFTDRVPTWARPSLQIRFTPSGSGTNNVTITNNGEIQHVTTTAWSSGQTSFPARYGLQKYNP